MASYRFCRSDDVPLLVDAYNTCFRPPGGAAAIDRDRFKRWVRVLELWTSSCLVATEGSQLIGVLLAAKRETENCVLAVGVHPDFRHLGHGRHMVTSLSQKLAILGPPRILAEVPASDERFSRFLQHCNYSALQSMADYRIDPPFGGSNVPAELVAEIGLDELADAGIPDDPSPRPWGRVPRSIERRHEYFKSVRVLALAGTERFEAALVVEESAATRKILAMRHGGDERSTALAGTLLRHYAAQGATPVIWERVHDDECPPDRAAAWGLVRGDETRMFETIAVPA
jgi:ribosomal protein S18 acetylase RimI-like enzyme